MQTRAAPGLSRLFAVFLRIGLLSFGGPAAQIALMHRVLVDEERWLNERDYLSALSFCMLLPGPEAMQLATYAGWRLRGTLGGIIAGLLFVVPGAALIFGLAALYAAYGDVALVDTLFLGVQAAAVVIVIEALAKVAGRALHGGLSWALAGGAFVAIFVFAVPFPAIILVAGLIGAWAAHDRAGQEEGAASPARVPFPATLRRILIGLVLWFAPIIALMIFAPGTILPEIGLFFSKLAVVTFGGAYAVLAYMAQAVVAEFGWLSAEEMIDGLGLAETTPGPLILVTQFVGFLAGHGAGGWPMAFAAGLVTLWVTFVPCFLWIFAGAPYLGWLSAQPRLAAALKAITAAVAGVILNLSVWFALHVLFADVTRAEAGPLRLWLPDIGTLDPRAAILIGLAAVLLIRLKLGIGWVLAASALAAIGLGAVL